MMIQEILEKLLLQVKRWWTITLKKDLHHNTTVFQKNGEHLRISIDKIIGDIEKGVSTRHSLNLFSEFYAFLSMVEPSTIEQTLNDKHRVMFMHDELN